MPRSLAKEGRPPTTLAGVFLFLLLLGCAAQRGPVLYPNEHLKAVGEGQTREDIAECNRLAENYVKAQPGAEAAKGAAGGAVAGGIVGGAVGAVTGHLGRGAAIGAVAGGTGGLIHGSAKEAQPSPVYKNFVDRCCTRKGTNPSAGNKRSEATPVDETGGGITRDPLPSPVSHAKFTFQGLTPLWLTPLQPGGGNSFSFYE